MMFVRMMRHGAIQCWEVKSLFSVDCCLTSPHFLLRICSATSAKVRLEIGMVPFNMFKLLHQAYPTAVVL